MKINLEVNIKFIVFFVLIILLVGCNAYKDFYIDEFSDRIYYQKETSCYFLTKDKSLKNYSSKRCFEEVYSFTNDEYATLKKIFFRVNGRKKQKETILISNVKSSKKMLVNEKGYGLLFVGGGQQYSFYFLRTERGLFYENCESKEKYYVEIDSSSKISIKLKVRLKDFLKIKCKGGETLLKFTSGRLY